ncbi:hypothetical protein C5C03_00275 [Clavibacter michiganensis]|uniref:thioredoxin domain-containing protein n=1 Tax=Clavibacter michiganensis TaxID=28447 RepID=UPI000CE7FD50|nr:thioredoxin domain-containing protein [Clavibacter michiganensis]PPF91296.1 hypothetical protein C5C03_00275 [Clavibacter michiganensis]PPF99338.1 hypothetical protein C5C05_02080 [Clavibacter michiganensis]
MSKKHSEARQRAHEIREKARIARAEDAAKQARRRTLIRVGVSGTVALSLAAVVVTAVVAERASHEPPVSPDNTASVVLAHGSKKVPVATGPDSILVGSPSAPVTLDVYEDYSCPHCGQFEAASGPLLDRIVETGQVRIAYHSLRVVTNYGTVAGNAAACVMAHQPSAWPGIHAALFKNHSASTDSWTKKDMSTWLTTRGVDDEPALACSMKGTFNGWITANTTTSAGAGVKSVPMLRIAGSTIPTVTGQDLVEALMSAGAVLPDGIANS